MSSRGNCPHRRLNCGMGKAIWASTKTAHKTLRQSTDRQAHHHLSPIPSWREDHLPARLTQPWPSNYWLLLLFLLHCNKYTKIWKNMRNGDTAESQVNDRRVSCAASSDSWTGFCICTLGRLGRFGGFAPGMMCMSAIGRNQGVYGIASFHCFTFIGGD